MGGTNYIRSKNGVLFTPPRIDTINNYVGFEDVTDYIGEAILSSLLIPAFSFSNYDLIEIESRLKKNGTGGIAVIRIRIGTGQTTSDVLVGTYSGTTSTSLHIPIKRTIKIAGVTSTTEVVDPTQNISFDDSFSSYTLSNLTIDWAKNNYISVTAQIASLTDTINCMYIKTKRFSTIL